MPPPLLAVLAVTTAAAAAATGGVAASRLLFAEESYFTLANSLTSAARVSASRGKSMTVVGEPRTETLRLSRFSCERKDS